MTFKTLLVCIAAIGTLGACGGGGESGANSGGSSNGNCQFAASDRRTLIQANEPRGLVDAAGIGLLDLRGQAGLATGTIDIALAPDPGVDAASLETQTFLGYSAKDPRTVSIAVPQRPSDAGVPVSLTVRECLPGNAQSFFIVLAHAPTDGYDGVPTMMALSSTFDERTRRVDALVPAFAFVPSGGRFVARLKIGVTGEDQRTEIVGATRRLSTAPTVPAPPSVPITVRVACPVEGGCTEISLFNPYRQIPVEARGLQGRLPVGVHLGADFAGTIGTAVRAKPGLVVVGGRTPARHRQMLTEAGDNFAKKGSGVYLTLLDEANFDRYRYLHLSDLADWAIDRNDPTKVAVGARVPSPPAGAVLTRIGSIGNTGLAPQTVELQGVGGARESIGIAADPRLHFEFAGNTTVQHCKTTVVNGVASRTCTGFPSHADPMLYMVRDFAVVPDLPGPYELDDSSRYRVLAADLLGQPVTSAVAAPLEEVPGHASRKQCLTFSSASAAIVVEPDIPWVLTEDSQWACTAWNLRPNITFPVSGTAEIKAKWTRTADRIPRLESGIESMVQAVVHPPGPILSVLPTLPRLSGVFPIARTTSCLSGSSITSFSYLLDAYTFNAPATNCNLLSGLGTYAMPAMNFGPPELYRMSHTDVPSVPGSEVEIRFGRSRAGGFVDTAGGRFYTASDGSRFAQIGWGVVGEQAVGETIGPGAPAPTVDYSTVLVPVARALQGSECTSPDRSIWRWGFDEVGGTISLQPKAGTAEAAISIRADDLLRGYSFLSYGVTRGSGAGFTVDSPRTTAILTATGPVLQTMEIAADEAAVRTSLNLLLQLPLASGSGTIALSCRR